MLGEKRSKAAFFGDSGQSVQEEKVSGMSHEAAPAESREPAPELTDKFSNLQFGSDYPVGDDTWKTQKEESGMDELESVADPETNEKEQPDGAENPSPQRRAARTLRTHDLFFAAENGSRDFPSVLREVQAYLSKEYSNLVTGDGSEEVKAQIRRFAGKYILDHRIAVEGMTTDELIDGIYSEMAEFGFLTKYIYGGGIEEIDGATRS